MFTHPSLLQDPASQLAQLVALEHLAGVTLADRVRTGCSYSLRRSLLPRPADVHACSQRLQLHARVLLPPRLHLPFLTPCLPSLHHTPTGARGAPGAQGAVRRGCGARAPDPGLVSSMSCVAALAAKGCLPKAAQLSSEACGTTDTLVPP